jgi:hypothetical protein
MLETEIFNAEGQQCDSVSLTPIFESFLAFRLCCFAPDALSVRSRKGRKVGCVESFLAFLLRVFVSLR